MRGIKQFIWSKEYGGRTLDSIMNIASITKLFTTTCIINLIEQGKLSLKDKLSKFFGQEILSKIHIYKGKDYSDGLTVGNLLFQNTGFPDVFAAEKNNLNKKMQREDFKVDFEEYIRIAKDNSAKYILNGKFYQLKGELIGHMGGSGTFAYYYPEKNLYLVGDVNQFAKPGLTFTLPLKIAKLANKYL